tara:strand:- start:935 stop:1981 length:1047 start_codon:yes stop_codon:yes gene_type:complete
MGKKNKNKKAAPNSKKELPFVSVCTPTFNRRPFIPMMLKCFNSQTYPKDKTEWIIIDDGTDKIEDLVKYHPNVKYFRYEEKMTLGKKRNLMHEKSCGDIIVYMDDDDYYPPTRISHAVEMLTSNSKALCAGSSELYIWFKHINQMYKFGPYGPNHATAGTFAFKRELLKQTKYDEKACLAEEKAFLKNYTIPFVQLDPKQTILVFSHIQNTFDKKTLLKDAPNRFCNPSDRTVEEFLTDNEIKQFFMIDIDDDLKSYLPGSPENKPDVIKQTKELMEQRRKMQEEQMNNKSQQPLFMMDHPEKGKIPLNPNQIVEILQKQQEKLKEQHNLIMTQQRKIMELEQKLKGT